MIIYPLTYFISIIIGFSSWGLAVPLVGAAGGVLTKIIFIDKSKWTDKESKIFAISGFIGASIGLLFFLITKDLFTIGTGFGFIIGSWQLLIGIKSILYLSGYSKSSCGNSE